MKQRRAFAIESAGAILHSFPGPREGMRPQGAQPKASTIRQREHM